MGMYTGLRVDVVVKPEYEEVIELLMSEEAWSSDNTWGYVAEKFPQYEFLRKWSEVYRSNFIPYGALCYMCGTWTEDEEAWEREISARRWRFQCSLKNYELEIEQFLSTVLPELTETSNLVMTQYEEDEFPTFWSLKTAEGSDRPVFQSERQKTTLTRALELMTGTGLITEEEPKSE